MHPLRVGLGPVNSAAGRALGKSIVTGEDVRRHPARDEFARHRGQRLVASRASRQRNHARVQAEAPDGVAQLAPDRVALDEKNIGRGPQAFVTRHQDAVVSASDLEEFSAGARGVGNNVGAEQAQPSRQAHQHSVNGESRGFIHRDGLYYITIDGERAARNIKRRFKF